ncbi:LapA family protein [Kitasatospora sp. NPDC001664]
MEEKTTTSERPSTVTVRGRSFRLRTLGIVLLAALAIWFIGVNTASVRIRLWIPTVTLPLWLVLAATLLVGAAIGWMAARRRAKR